SSGSTDGTVRLWEVASGREVRLEGDMEAVTALDSLARFVDGVALHWTGVVLSPDGRLLASGSKDETMRLWEVASGRELHRWEDDTRGVGGPAFSPDGRLLAFSFAKELRVLCLR